MLEFKKVNGIIDTIKYNNILYTFNNDSTYTNVNEYVLLGLPSNHGIYKYSDTSNKIMFNLLFDNPLVYELYKDVEYSWQDLKVENDTLKVKFVTKNLENNSIKSIKRKFIKV